jgi:hypothetical protein
MSKLTVEELQLCHLTTTMFLDGAGGAAKQLGSVKEHPRIFWCWERKNRRDQAGRRTWSVGDKNFEDGQWQAIVDAYNQLGELGAK